MARGLVFKINDDEYTFTPGKIDRKKLYGWTETIALDDAGNELKLVSMDESGTVIIPKGSLGMGAVDGSLNWVEKDKLMAVDLNGSSINPLPSSFSESIILDKTITCDEYLDHMIVSMYELEEADNNVEFIEAIKDKIYTFDFNYREGYESSPAFIIENEGKAFMVVGVKTDFEFIGLEEVGYLDTSEDDEEFSEELGIDFDMF